MKLGEVITEDFNLMRSMLDEIEMKILGVGELTQVSFYSPIKRMIFEAWTDACDPDDNFLYPKQ